MRISEGQNNSDVLKAKLERPNQDGLDIFRGGFVDGATRQEAKGKTKGGPLWMG